MLSVAALICSLIAYTNYSQFAELKTWKKISANVVSSTAYQKIRGRRIANCPEIFVKYDFQGKSFVSKLIISNYPCSLLKSSALSDVEKITSNKSIDILVNPINANQVKVSTFSLGFGFYFMILASVLTLYSAILFALTSSKKL